MKDKKRMILQFLTSVNRASTKAISMNIRANRDRCQFLLDELEKEYKIIRHQETRDCYWVLNNKIGGVMH